MNKSTSNESEANVSTKRSRCTNITACLENRRDNALRSIRRTPQSPHSIRRNSNIGNQNARTRAPAFQTPASHVADLDHLRGIQVRSHRPQWNRSEHACQQLEQMALQASTTNVQRGGGMCSEIWNLSMPLAPAGWRTAVAAASRRKGRDAYSNVS
jgi:hypothetical protein